MRRSVKRALVAVLVASWAAAACSDRPDTGSDTASSVATSDGAAGTSSAGTTTPGTTPATAPATASGQGDDVVIPEGFDRVRAKVTDVDGTVCELCLWLADTGDRRSRGLMFVTDLGPADGMAFVYPSPHSGNFWMKNTLLPLSIAFFAPDGAYLDSFDMEPCTEEPCGLYRTPDDFLVAIETTRGGLADLGIGPGSVLEMSDASCDEA